MGNYERVPVYPSWEPTLSIHSKLTTKESQRVGRNIVVEETEWKTLIQVYAPRIKKEPIFTDKFFRKIKSSKVKYYTISYIRL